ncbi:hypothetical protein [Dyella agri]|uniref:Lipocalin-like domain-containing protein n=1 Tax=Dyella agri TaxID=1926869 RepID=A0ABW8KMT3_9GAMM
MKSLLIAGLVLALFAPASALAQNTFDGTWKTDPASIQDTGKPITVTLKDGVFHCDCDNPAVNVKADGKDHPTAGHIGYDTSSVEVVNNNKLHMIEKKAGKVVGDSTLTASADGGTVTNEFTDTSGSSPVTGKVVFERVGKAMPGSNLTTGVWKLKNIDNYSDNALTFTYKIDGNTVNFKDSTGDSYTAMMGGKAVPVHETTNTHATVSVLKVGKNGMRETYMHDGKPTSTVTMTLSDDGKSMKSIWHNLRTGRSGSSMATRQ